MSRELMSLPIVYPTIFNSGDRTRASSGSGTFQRESRRTWTVPPAYPAIGQHADTDFPTGTAELAELHGQPSRSRASGASYRDFPTSGTDRPRPYLSRQAVRYLGVPRNGLHLSGPRVRPQRGG